MSVALGSSSLRPFARALQAGCTSLAGASGTVAACEDWCRPADADIFCGYCACAECYYCRNLPAPPLPRPPPSVHPPPPPPPPLPLSQPCSGGTTVYERDVSFVGNDLCSTTARLNGRMVTVPAACATGVPSADACARECRVHTQATARFFTFRFADGGRCWCKSSDMGRRANPGRTSGAVCYAPPPLPPPPPSPPPSPSPSPSPPPPAPNSVPPSPSPPPPVHSSGRSCAACVRRPLLLLLVLVLAAANAVNAGLVSHRGLHFARISELLEGARACLSEGMSLLRGAMGAASSQSARGERLRAEEASVQLPPAAACPDDEVYTV